MKHHRLIQREQTRQQGEQRTATEGTREFASVEEALRCDAAQTDVPPALTRKIQAAAADAFPTRKRAWWRLLPGR